MLKTYDQDMGRSVPWEERQKSHYGKEPRYNYDNVIEMILDLNKLTLSFIIDGKDYGVAFENIKPSRYKACMSCGWGTKLKYIPE